MNLGTVPNTYSPQKWKQPQKPIAPIKTGFALRGLYFIRQKRQKINKIC